MALGGMTPAAPLDPYAYSGGAVMRALVSTVIEAKLSSHARMTLTTPI
jgi:hypothetical protein